MKKIILAIILVMSLGLVGSVNAAFTCTVVTPADNARLNGDELFNITVAGINNNTVMNCSVTATSSDTGDSWTVGTAYNWSVDASAPFLNLTNSSYNVADCLDLAVAANCTNGTSTVTCTGTTGIDVDNTVPAFSSALPATGTTDEDGEVSFSIVGSNATSATLYINEESFGMSESSDTFTYSATLGGGTRDWYVIASDGTNSTTSSTYELDVDVNTGGGVPASMIPSLQKQQEAKSLSIAGTIQSSKSKISLWIAKESQPWEITKTIIVGVIGMLIGFIPIFYPIGGPIGMGIIGAIGGILL